MKKRVFLRLFGIFLIAIGVKLILVLAVLAIKPNLPENLQEYLVIDSTILNLVRIAFLAIIFLLIGRVILKVVNSMQAITAFNVEIKEEMSALLKIEEAFKKANIEYDVKDERGVGIQKKFLYVDKKDSKNATRIMLKIYPKA